MNKPGRVIVLLACCAAVGVFLLSCSQSPSPPQTLAMAPPGPSDLGPATGLSTPPKGAAVFDLKYAAQRGGADDIQYHSYWGYGGMMEETKTNSFLQEVRQKASRLHYVYSPAFRSRKWAAVEYTGQQASALYFDADGDGKLGDNERIAPTRKVNQGVEFITPDFINPLEGGGQTLCRALLQVNFYGAEPNSMWSPAALLEGTGTLDGQPARLLLYASNPGGGFDNYGSSSYSLLLGSQTKIAAGTYVPRETLSSLVSSEGRFYRLSIEGRRSNGLPARVVVLKDTSPTGGLTVKLAGSNALQASFSSLYLHGTEDQTVFFRVGSTKDKISLPVGAYAIDNGAAKYGISKSQEWEVWFTEGPRATVKAGEVLEVALGQPSLKVRAIEEKDRYNRQAMELTSFKQGTQIYLEPRILGKGREVFSRFRQATARGNDSVDRPPKITITAADGKQVLATTMEYG